MSRHHFDRSLLTPPQLFYERELGALGRPSRGWAKANCPFHASESKKSFAVNLTSGGFYCFGCQTKGGDVICFLRKRYGYSFQQACEVLGVWSGPGLDVREIRRLQLEGERLQSERAGREEAKRRERVGVRDRLHRLEQSYAYWNQRLIELRKENDLHMESQDADTMLLFLSDCLHEVRIAQSEYLRMCGVVEE